MDRKDIFLGDVSPAIQDGLTAFVDAVEAIISSMDEGPVSVGAAVFKAKVMKMSRDRSTAFAAFAGWWIAMALRDHPQTMGYIRDSTPAPRLRLVSPSASSHETGAAAESRFEEIEALFGNLANRIRVLQQDDGSAG